MKDYAQGETRILTGLEGNDAPKLSPMQETLLPHVESIALFWWLLWGLALLVVVRHFFKEIKNG